MIVVFLLLFLACRIDLHAAVRLPVVFGDGMVLQHGRPVPVWGDAAPGEAISLSVGGKPAASCVADGSGQWRTVLPAMQPGPVGDLAIEGKNQIVLKNILAGEVWLCSGQSNMRMPVGRDAHFNGVLNWEREVRDANHPGLRFFDGTWKVCSPKTAGEAYAVAYFFGRDLHRDLNMPVGLLEAAVGGSPIEAWVAPAVWTDDLKRRCVEAYRPEYAVRMEEYRKSVDGWEQAVKQAAEQGTSPPKQPNPPGSPEAYPARASALYNRLIQPLAPYAVRGVLWYQGETNAWRIEPYRDLLALLISGWREQWSDPDMPFLIVQLANWGQAEKHTRAAGRWPELRAMQADVARNTPHCSLITTLDVGDTVDLHPPNKQEVGRRAALAALQSVYGKDLLARGPEPTAVKWTPGGARITFDHTGAALTLDAPQGGFELAGNDGKFFPAEARVDGPTVILSASEIRGVPRQVRYAWKDDPTGLLHNSENLPAPPFRRERE
ncbi:MAG: sialate O-acetylesterase [Tepidisphaeraceae bacterium]